MSVLQRTDGTGSKLLACRTGFLTDDRGDGLGLGPRGFR